MPKTEPISQPALDGHKAEMFDALRDFFIALTALAKIGTTALQAELDKHR